MSSINHRIDRGYGRRSGLRPIKQSFLIITEGVNTEPDYFTSFCRTFALGKPPNDTGHPHETDDEAKL